VIIDILYILDNSVTEPVMQDVHIMHGARV